MDKTVKINSLISKGIISRETASHYTGAPEAVLEELDRLPALKRNAFPTPNRPGATADDEAMTDEEKQAEADKKEALALLKKKRDDDATQKTGAIETLKKNSACKLDETQLRSMDLPTLKALAASIGERTNYFAAAGAPAGSEAPKTNNSFEGMTPPMISQDEVLKTLQQK